MCLSLGDSISIVRTGWPTHVELIGLVNSIIIFFISNDLIQIVSFPALIHGCCSQSSSSGFISFFWHNYLFYNGVPSIGKSWLCCLSFQCLSVKLKRDVTFYYIAYNYLRADWEGIYDHLWTVPWENIFKPNASVASEFC